ncbi:MAG: 30S ribosomal protein S12 methylthiotransferase RimO [Aquificae bacterium]|nr:30S ribosomal protein S12 methylthiotransferase RimO [Aquificota bacterium]
MKIGVVSLGCAKNLVDTEVLLGKLKSAGAEITPNPEEADFIVINTCGFIEPAKLESIETILEFLEKGKKVIVAGCLAQRYREEIKKEFPEVEAVFGTESWDEILKHLGLREKKKTERLLTTPGSYAYLKIAEGCNRLCSFCAIPSIRGRHRSRPVEEVLKEARDLAQKGVKELCVISQDTSYYGKDLYGEYKLPELLRELERIEGIKWIRLLYLYPTEVKDELIAYIRDSEKVLPYFDIPLQHVSDSVLRSMRRGYGKKFVLNLLERIMKEIPQATLRTAFIVGYPTEGEREFEELLSFVEEGYFHWVGVFTYSQEEGTPSFGLGDPVPQKVKEERKEAVISVQREITRKKNEAFLGKELEVLVDGYDEEFSWVPKGRAYFQAPEVDGVVYLESENPVKVGEFVRARITQVADYDLGGRVGVFTLLSEE